MYIYIYIRSLGYKPHERRYVHDSAFFRFLWFNFVFDDIALDQMNRHWSLCSIHLIWGYICTWRFWTWLSCTRNVPFAMGGSSSAVPVCYATSFVRCYLTLTPTTSPIVFKLCCWVSWLKSVDSWEIAVILNGTWTSIFLSIIANKQFTIPNKFQDQKSLSPREASFIHREDWEPVFLISIGLAGLDHTGCYPKW